MNGRKFQVIIQSDDVTRGKYMLEVSAVGTSDYRTYVPVRGLSHKEAKLMKEPIAYAFEMGAAAYRDNIRELVYGDNAGAIKTELG